MIYRHVNSEFIAKVVSIVGEAFVFTEKDQLKEVASDHTEDFTYFPELLVVPQTAAEIAQIVQLCNEYRVPLTPRGGGTGVSGGALPVHGGVVLSLRRLNKIINIDRVNRCATVESGVITQVFQEAVLEKGLFFPPDPGSKGSCFLGGNLAESSGGPKSLKYGVTKDYVLNMEVVLPSGEIIWTGKNVTKNATGYDLTNLICGSEGTLGIITKIVFRLINPPQNSVLMLMPFEQPENVFTAVQMIAEKGFAPTALEFIDERSIHIIQKYKQWNGFPGKTPKAYLWIELDGDHYDTVLEKCATLAEMLHTIEPTDAAIAQTKDEQENLWTLRKQVGECIMTYSVFKDIDTVVPISQLAALISGLKEIEQTFGFRTACFGHIGNGNLHLQILKEQMSDDDWKGKVKQGVGQLFALVNQLGGSLSGEHGIGILQKEFLPVTVPAPSIEIMKNIKKVFDPNHILNPGKIF